MRHAMEIALTGRLFTAAQMMDRGVINHVARDGPDATAVAMGWARDIVQGAPLAISATKQMMLRGLDHASLSDAFDGDYPAHRRMLDSADAREGTAAFLAKRAPKWLGR